MNQRWKVLKVKAQKLDRDYHPLVVAILHSDSHARMEDGAVLEVVRERPSKLTPRRLDALRTIATGLCGAAAAKHLNIKQTTFRTHLLEARRCLGATTTAEAVAIGVRAGWI